MKLCRSSNYKKAGLSGLFLLSLVALSMAQPVKLVVAEVSTRFDQRMNEPVLDVKLADESAWVFAKLTRDNVGKAANFRVDGQVLTTPVIREEVRGGSLLISGNFTPGQAADIVHRIKRGAIVELEVVQVPQ